MRPKLLAAALTWLLLKQNDRSEEHTSELQSLRHLVCRLLLEKKKTTTSPRSSRHRIGTTMTGGTTRLSYPPIALTDLICSTCSLVCSPNTLTRGEHA